MSNRHRDEILLSLLNTHGSRLYAIFYRLTLSREGARDLLQDLFAKLSDTPAFVVAANAPAYAFRVAINLAMQWRRRRRETVDIGQAAPVHAPSISPLESLIAQEDMQRLLDALPELSELTREAFVLRFIEDQSYQAVATIMGKTQHQVRGLCHDAVKQLRGKLSLPKPVTP